MKHKWHKEIKAWADGAEIECKHPTFVGSSWEETKDPMWLDDVEYRIKPQPKVPNYMYVLLRKHDGQFCLSQVPIECHPANAFIYMGKIKLELEHE